MVLHSVIEEFLLYLSSVKGLSSNTVSSYSNDLKLFEAFIGSQCEMSKITLENLLSCIGGLSRQHKAGTSINRFISAVRTLFAFSYKFGYIPKNPALELKTVKIPKHIPKFMTKEDADSLCTKPEIAEQLWASRDCAIFEMLYSSGCRVSEIANLKLQDFTNGYKAAVVRGKGNKERIVYFGQHAQRALELYLHDRTKKLLDLGIEYKSFPKNLFVNQKGTPLTTGGIRFILNKYSGPAGSNKHINPHAFRHTFATQMLNNGADVRLVQEMLGHSSISTTQRYTHITTDRLIEIYNKAHPHS